MSLKEENPEDHNRWVSSTHWRREGKQSRSEKTQTAILDATERLLINQGTDATSVADIANEAGCSIGSVYHHFKDKTAILHALFQRTTDGFAYFIDHALVESEWEGMDIRDILSRFIDMSQKSRTDRPGYKAAAYLIATDHPELREHYFELQNRLYKGLAKLLLTRKAEIHHPYPQRAVGFVLDQLGAMLRVNADAGQQSAQLVAQSERTFKQEFLRSSLAYLTDPHTGG